MKKIILFIFLAMLFIPIEGFSKEKAVVYVFTKEKEEISNKLLEYLDELKHEYSIDYKNYSVWDENWQENKEYRNLVNAVAEYFNKEVLGAPILVIGNDYYDEYNESIKEDIKISVDKLLKQDNYKDVIKITQKQIAQRKKKDQIMTYILLGGGILLFGIIILLARSNTKKDLSN